MKILSGWSANPLLVRERISIVRIALHDAALFSVSLGDFWGQLCVTPSIASAWAERLWGTTTRVLGPDGHGEFFTGTTACLSALYGAQRYDKLIRLVDSARFNWWHYRRWGVDALMAQGLPAEALRYAQGSQASNAPFGAVAKASEAILLQSGMIDEAYSWPQAAGSIF